MIKKATTKRERKYGKKVEDYEDRKEKPDKEVRLMIDGYSILKFKNRKAAEAYIERKSKEAIHKRRRPASFIFL